MNGNLGVVKAEKHRKVLTIQTSLGHNRKLYFWLKAERVLQERTMGFETKPSLIQLLIVFPLKYNHRHSTEHTQDYS